MVRPTVGLFLEEATVCACHYVLMAADLYFTEYWQSARHFRPAALASPNPLAKYYWLIYKKIYISKILIGNKMRTTAWLIFVVV